METIVFEDSPLAEILKASERAEGDNGDLSTTAAVPASPIKPKPFAFAPKGFPKLKISTSRSRRKSPEPSIANSARLLVQLKSRALNLWTWRIGQSDEFNALEQLRYTIIGSQLLSDHTAGNGLSRRQTGLQAPPKTATEEGREAQYTVSGLIFTGCSAFTCALSIWWATTPTRGRLSKIRITLVGIFLTAMSTWIYIYCVRQYRRFTCLRAIETASSMVSSAQSFDASAHAASSLIQEVELVSRGYRLSSPLPPASRLEDAKSQTRRCARLRRSLRSALDALISPHVQAYHQLHPLADEIDLDRYFDMYELSRTDISEFEESITDRSDEADDSESIRVLKIDMHRLFTARKMFLCAVLALDADTKSRPLNWSMMTEVIDDLSTIQVTATANLDRILDEDDRFSVPTTPKSPVTPSRERLQNRMRKFNTLSQGLRGLQAKMHILREESDKALGSSDEVTALGTSLLEQYDAIGSDLRTLMADWEEGRSALTASIGKNERRISLSSTGMLFSRSPTPSSLGGITEVGSPSEAFKILTGDPIPTLDAGSSDEEVFEAMASPRPRNTLTREERIAKMKEDRARQATAREQVDASRFMVKELETVIRARPRARTNGRVTSI